MPLYAVYHTDYCGPYANDSDVDAPAALPFIVEAANPTEAIKADLAANDPNVPYQYGREESAVINVSLLLKQITLKQIANDNTERTT